MRSKYHKSIVKSLPSCLYMESIFAMPRVIELLPGGIVLEYMDYIIDWFPASLLIQCNTKARIDMLGADTRMVRLRQEKLCNNGGYEAWFGRLE